MWNTHNCSMCHSGMATGTKGEYAAPNLRMSTLKAADIRETVACGRGVMPTHRWVDKQRAWTHFGGTEEKDARDIIYFVTLIAAFLFANAALVDLKKST